MLWLTWGRAHEAERIPWCSRWRGSVAARGACAAALADIPVTPANGRHAALFFGVPPVGSMLGADVQSEIRPLY